VLPNGGKIQNSTAACADTAETALVKHKWDALRAMPACKCEGLIRPSPKDALWTIRSISQIMCVATQKAVSPGLARQNLVYILSTLQAFLYDHNRRIEEDGSDRGAAMVYIG